MGTCCIVAGFVLGEDHIRSDGPDLVENQLFAGEGNGHYQNDRGHAVDNAKRGEKCADLIGDQCLVTELKRFLEEEHQPPFACFNNSSAFSRGTLSGVRGLFRYLSSNAAALSKLRFCLMYSAARS